MGEVCVKGVCGMCVRERGGGRSLVGRVVVERKALDDKEYESTQWCDQHEAGKTVQHSRRSLHAGLGTRTEEKVSEADYNTTLYRSLIKSA